MADSQTLRLMFALDAAHVRLLAALCASLAAKGYEVTPSVLGFLGQLDCGVNYASEIARHLGVSRQMVHKTVRDMESLGFLHQKDDPDHRNRKRILFTDSGVRLMAEARRELLRWDTVLDGVLGAERLAGLLDDLDRIAVPPSGDAG